MSAELEVPVRSIEGVGMLACAMLPNAEEWARAIATPIVVAELRRLADESVSRMYASVLYERADELERDLT